EGLRLLIHGWGKDENRDPAAGGVSCVGGTGVVFRDDVKDDGSVGRVPGVAVGGPARGAEVDFDVAAEEVPAGVEHGAADVGAGPGTGDAGEDDAQRTAVDECERREAGFEPAQDEGGFAGIREPG